MVLYGFGIPLETVKEDPIAVTLSMYRVADIKEVIDILALPVKKSGKKQDLIDRVVEFIHLFPQDIVNHLSLDEIEVFKRLLAGEEVVVDSLVATTFYVLVQLGAIRLWEMRGEEQDICRLVLGSEAENLFKNLIEEVTISPGHQIQQFVRRWSSLCGVLPVDTIVRYLNRLDVFGEISRVEVLEALKQFGDERLLLREQSFNEGKGDTVYVTQWCYIVGSIGKLLLKDKIVDGKKVQVNAFEPKVFSYEEIMGVGLPLFAPVTPNAAARNALVAMWKKVEMGKWEIEANLLRLWEEKQQDGISAPSFGRFLSRLGLSSIEEYNQVSEAATHYLNTLPFWQFLGKSSFEEMKDNPIDPKRPPKLVAGPNMRAAGLDISPQQQRIFEQMIWESQMASRMPSGQWPVGKQVGRNDPCPCGSGKKFKHCCGR